MNVRKCLVIALLTVLILLIVCKIHASLYGSPLPTSESMVGKYKMWGGHEYQVPYPAQWVNEYR